LYEFKEKSLTMRSSGLGGCNRKGVGGFFGLSCMWFQRSPVEAPKPLNAGVVRCIPGGRRLAMSERFGQWTSGQAGPDNRTHRLGLEGQSRSDDQEGKRKVGCGIENDVLSEQKQIPF